MVMTTEEIVRSYRESANQIKQIAILADLNVCKQGKICEILLEAGEELPKRRGGWKIPKNVGEADAASDAPENEPSTEENDDYNLETVGALIDALEIYREKGRRNADQMKKELDELRQRSERIEARLENVNAVCDTISQMIEEVRGHE